MQEFPDHPLAAILRQSTEAKVDILKHMQMQLMLHGILLPYLSGHEIDFGSDEAFKLLSPTGNPQRTYQVRGADIQRTLAAAVAYVQAGNIEGVMATHQIDQTVEPNQTSLIMQKQNVPASPRIRVLLEGATEGQNIDVQRALQLILLPATHDPQANNSRR